MVLLWLDLGDCAESGTVYTLLCLTGMGCLYSCSYRSRLRAQYDLEESPCVDCLVHFCCEGCALCQEYRELKNRGLDMGIGTILHLTFTPSPITSSQHNFPILYI